MDINSLVHTDALKDKSLWIAVLTPAVLMVLKLFNVQVSDAQVGDLIALAVTFIASSKLKQAVIAHAVVNNQPDVATPFLKPTEALPEVK